MSEEPQKTIDDADAQQPEAPQNAAAGDEVGAEATAGPPPSEEAAPETEDAAAEEVAAADEAADEQQDADEQNEDSVEEASVDEEEVEEEAAAPPQPKVEPEPEPTGPIEMDWYILKVQSNRERSIADALRRKVNIEGLEEFFGEVVVPTEKVTEFKGGKKKIVERKLYPGYIVVHMHINDDTWFAVRETSGIGDFTGSGGKPTPMLPHEVARIIQKDEEETDEAPKLDIKFKLEDKVKVKDGTFEGFEGEVSAIDDQSGKITVMLSIFGRSTPVELEYWQVESV